MRRSSCIVFLASVLGSALLQGMDYRVTFEGIDDPEVVKTVKNATFLTTLKNQKPISINALRFRAESDLVDVVKAMHAHGYYDAKASVRFKEDENWADVFVVIDPGPVYKLRSFDIEGLQELDLSDLNLGRLGIQLDVPAKAMAIIEAEHRLLGWLSDYGYPLARVIDRKFVANYEDKSIHVILKVEPGSLCYFGSLTIEEKGDVKKQLFDNKMAWIEGERYTAAAVDTMQRRLLSTGLFSSVLITHADETGPDQRLAMRLEATETQHRSINVGASYQTFFGPGLTFGWEHRNVGGLGRTLALKGDVTARTHTGTATFFVPDWWKVDQDYVSEWQALQESVYAYHEHAYRWTQRIERRIDTRYRVSIGLRAERLLVSNSVDDGTFTLAELPLYFRWSSANDLLNATRGSTVEVTASPAVNLSDVCAGGGWNRYYLRTTVTYASYAAPFATDTFVLAQQLTLNSIWSQHLRAVPVPERILGGTDENARGYRFKTVSPLEGHKPIGGRFGLFYTLESRFRLNASWGVVPFFDLAHVELPSYPEWRGKWYRSLGVGIRYFTFLGPIRGDVAVPLDRRHGIDSRYRLLVSIGQTF